MQIRQDSRAELGYTIIGPNGEVFESTEESGPIEYVHGSGDLPQGLAEALEGCKVGDEIEVSLEPGQAFGDYNPDGIVAVPRDEFPDGTELVPGEWISVTIEEGEDEDGEMEMRVVEVNPETIMLDANHPLAGKEVTFKVQVLGVS